ncbi:hypothetical protein HY251_04605 [bacterium]|nr:hypothetical protein [bacterium]
MTRAAKVLIAALVLVALVRALLLEIDPYDAYEVRAAARAIAGDRSAPFAFWRSALLALFEAPFERLARGSALAWCAPHVLSALAYGGLALATLALARAAGASPLAAHAAAVAVALDRLAFADAALGFPDALAAALAAGGLAFGLRALEAPAARPALLAGTALGLAAAAKPNAGLACLALVVVALGVFFLEEKKAGERREERALVAILGACGLALLLYLFLQNLFFVLGRGDLREGLATGAALREFHALQFAENARKYGSQSERGFSPALVYLRAALAMEPWTALLLPASVPLALARGNRASRALALAAILQLVFLTRLVGHGEARYLLPAMPPFAALAALVLDRAGEALRARAPARARAALVAASIAWAGLPLALGARFEAERARDPVFSRNFSRTVADGIAAITTGRVFWTPGLPYAVYPRVLARDGTPFPGDPFHGICHAGPLTVEHHLGRRVSMPIQRDEQGRELPGASTPEDVLALAQAIGVDDGDVVLLVPREQVLSWKPGSLPEPQLPLRRFRARRDGARVRLEPLEDVSFR